MEILHKQIETFHIILALAVILYKMQKLLMKWKLNLWK